MGRQNHEVAQLLQRAAAAQREADVLCAQSASLVRRRRQAGPTRHGIVRRRYAALPSSVPLARAAVVRLAVRSGMGTGRLEAVRLAVSEAMTNAVLHAYPSSTGAIYLTAGLTDDALKVLIADDGVGPRATPRNPRRGWGWPLMSGCCDRVSITARGGDGTLVEMRWIVGVNPRTALTEARPVAVRAGSA